MINAFNVNDPKKLLEKGLQKALKIIKKQNN